MNHSQSRGLRASLSKPRERSDSPAKVLLHMVDDFTREAVAQALRRDGYQVTDVATGSAALAHLRERLPHRAVPELVVLDSATEGVELLESLGRLGRAWSLPPCVGLIGAGDAASFELADRLGFSWVIEQPVSPLMLRASVHAAAPL